VRLFRGDYQRVTVHGDDPVAQALAWHEQGADLIHIVDLDAARGQSSDRRILERITDAGIAYQIGGGIRSASDAARAIDAGARRVVVGSAFTSSDGRADEIVGAVGADRVVAALDVRDGRAVGSGWLDAGTTLGQAIENVLGVGVPRALVTGIERDGTLDGPDTELLDSVRRVAPQLRLIASGGVGTLADLRRLRSHPARLEAAIVGRALYEGRFTYTDALSAVSVRGEDSSEGDMM
jgi:phosphoribosylformimino-5-aminoimidazole carboxamide ribotide isomerase